MERLRIDDIEFYTIGSDVWYLTSDGGNEKLDESKKEVIAVLIDRIMECYPDAYEAMEKWYSRSSANVTYYRWLIATRFVKCNFGRLDTTAKDVKGSAFRFEKVECPMRGECRYEGIVCMPVFNSRLSEAEMRVMRLVHDGLSNEDIADRLYLSPNTVKNHIKSVYAKLDIHEKSEFIRYADKNNLFG